LRPFKRAVDAYLLMLCRWTRGMQHPAPARPHLARLLEAVMARPATQRAFAAEGIAAPFY
jgi:glutathione S-transferase